jgi:hypothetical protein
VTIGNPKGSGREKGCNNQRIVDKDQQADQQTRPKKLQRLAQDVHENKHAKCREREAQGVHENKHAKRREKRRRVRTHSSLGSFDLMRRLLSSWLRIAIGLST